MRPAIRGCGCFPSGWTEETISVRVPAAPLARVWTISVAHGVSR
jgi:hypothetical protein